MKKTYKSNLKSIVTLAGLLSPLVYGFTLQAADFNITNGQTVTTTQTLSNDDVGVVEQGGSISTLGGSVHGIDATGSNATITNSGSISTVGDSAHGIDSRNLNVKITNSGSISTSVINAHGIYSSGSNATITNSGSISTSGLSAHGINSRNLNATITNSGSISTSGGSSFGIDATGSNATITNSGSISTSGTTAFGIDATGSNATITNSGSISTSGATAYGIISTGSNATITNSGSISTSGATAYGIISTGSNATITNSGSISTTGAGSKAININGNDTTLILKAGSELVGTVDFNVSTGGKIKIDNTVSIPLNGGGGAIKKAVTSLANIVGTYTMESGAASVSGDIGNGVLVQSDDTIVVVTPDIFAGTDQMITEVVIGSNNLVNNHLQEARLNGRSGVALASQVANNGLVYSDVAENTDALADPATAWLEGFGSYQERPKNKDAAFFRVRSGGILGGIDLPTTEQEYSIGFYIGGFIAQQDLGKLTFRDITSKGMLVGGYVSKEFNGIDVDLQLSTGVSFNDSDRNVGTDTASADFNSYFLSPSVTISKDISYNEGVLVPSFTLRYSGQYTETYKESGSIADQSVDSQYNSTISASMMLENRFEDMAFESGVLKPAFRVGLDGQSYIGSRSTDLNVLGTDVSFDPNGSDQFVDGVAGINLSFNFDDGPELYMDSEINVGLNQGTIADNFGGTVRTGLKWNF